MIIKKGVFIWQFLKNIEKLLQEKLPDEDFEQVIFDMACEEVIEYLKHLLGRR